MTKLASSISSSTSSSDAKKTVAILGAGVSGLTCAKLLEETGRYSVIVFEKSRGVGGRMATRRIDNFQFDHGLQYLKNNEIPMAQEVLKKWGDVYVPSPSANALCKNLAHSLTVETGAEIDLLKVTRNKWTLASGDRDLGTFDIVILTAPPEQTYSLLPLDVSFKKIILQAQMAPCFSLMVGFNKNLNCHWTSQRLISKEIAWIAQDSSKPDRDPTQTTFVAQSTVSWAQEKLEQDIPTTEKEFLEIFLNVTQLPNEDVIVSKLHRWRYALTSQPLGQSHLWDTRNNIGVCGDWLLGKTIYSAIESAESLARALTLKT